MVLWGYNRHTIPGGMLIAQIRRHILSGTLTLVILEVMHFSFKGVFRVNAMLQSFYWGFFSLDRWATPLCM